MKRIALVLTVTLLLTSFGCTRRLAPFPKPEPSGYRPSAHAQKGLFWGSMGLIGIGLVIEHMVSRNHTTRRLAWVYQQYNKLNRKHRALRAAHDNLTANLNQMFIIAPEGAEEDWSEGQEFSDPVQPQNVPEHVGAEVQFVAEEFGEV